MRLEFDPWVGKIPTQEKEMATHSSILAWEFSWTEETGGLQFMGFMEGPKKLLFTWILSVNIYCIGYMSIISQF